METLRAFFGLETSLPLAPILTCKAVFNCYIDIRVSAPYGCGARYPSRILFIKSVLQSEM